VKVAKSIVGSSLVKTAIFGTDPNWGRLIVAIGYSGVDIDPDVIDLSLGDINLLKNSEPVNYSEELATKNLENDNIYININLNRSEEHTSELQSRFDLVCSLLL